MSNPLTDFLHSPSFYCWLSAMAGSFVPAAMTDNLPPRKRVLNFICGGLIGICVAPAVTFKFFPGHDYSTPIPYFISFLVGASGVSLYPLAIKILSMRLQKLQPENSQ